MLKDFHTLRKQPSGKRVIDQVSGNRQQPHIMWVHFAVALQGPKIIGIPAFGPQAFEYSPISATASRADLTCQESAEIFDHPIVVEQGVVDIEQENPRRFSGTFGCGPATHFRLLVLRWRGVFRRGGRGVSGDSGLQRHSRTSGRSSPCTAM